jgi:hypothetical protein
MKYKGRFRILPELDKETNDFPRDSQGNIDESYNDLYISCQYGNKITVYGHMGDNKKTMWLTAYIPSVVRGKNILKALDKKGIQYVQPHILDEEVEFKFKAKDIEEVAILLKAKTNGCDISPFSIKNLPKANVKIPTEEIEKYKAISARVEKGDLLLIHRITDAFLANILSKKLRKTEGKSFNLQNDMRKLMMARMPKEYIFTKNMWNEYLTYLKKEIDKFYSEGGK